MPKLIKPDWLTNSIATYLATNAYLNDTAQDVLEMIAAWVRYAPTVDAVEVVHGRWVRCKDWDYDYECSVCEGYAVENKDGNYDILTHYCPNCGAKMDGDGNGN